MRLLTLEHNTAYELNEIPEEVDDVRFCVLDNSDPKDPDYFFIPLIFLESFNSPALVLRIDNRTIKMPVDWQTGQKNTYDMVHADLVLIIDKMGHWRWLDLGAPKTTGNIPQKLKDFLSPQGLQNLTKPEEPTWSLSAVTSALTELIGKKIN